MIIIIILIITTTFLTIYYLYKKFYEWYYKDFTIKFNDNVEVLLFDEEEIVVDIFKNDKKHKQNMTCSF